jgi:hypothetical protein
LATLKHLIISLAAELWLFIPPKNDRVASLNFTCSSASASPATSTIAERALHSASANFDFVRALEMEVEEDVEGVDPNVGDVVDVGDEADEA